MRMYAWVAPMVLVAAGTSACSTSTRTQFAATAAAVANAADSVPEASARPQPPPRVVASPVVATPRAISIGEKPPTDAAAIGSPDAQPLRPVAAVAVPSRPCNATCPVIVGMPVDPACTATWRGCCIAFCDVDARTRWEADPATFASNLPPTLSETPIRAPFPGAKLASAPAPASAVAQVSAPGAAKKPDGPSSGTVPLAPTQPPKVVKVTLQPTLESPFTPGNLFGEDEDGECKDGSCRLPLPPR